MFLRISILYMLISALVQVEVGACTVIYAFKNGIILGGNNEDWEDPNTKFWIIPDNSGMHGWIKFGFEGGYPQGGMNDQGLFWDATAGPHLEMPISEANKNYYSGSLMQKIIEKCSCISEARDIFKEYYCDDQYKAQYLIGDPSGYSMIVEGDNIIHNEFNHQVLTNFYQSHPDLGGYPCWRYETATELLDTCQTVTPHIIGTILANTHQEGRYPTQYSNIYDLKNGIVYLFYFHNYQEFICIDLHKEINRGYNEYSIPGLFSQMSPLSPVDGEKVNTTSVTFKWMGLPGSSYELQYSQSPSFTEYQSRTILYIRADSNSQPSQALQKVGVPIILLLVGMNIIWVRKKITPMLTGLILAVTIFACSRNDNEPIDNEPPVELSITFDGFVPGSQYYWRILASSSSLDHFFSETTTRSFTIRN